MTNSLANRFWSKVEVGHPSACWLWTAAVGNHGYGVIGIGHSKIALAHRVAYELLIQMIPDGLTLDHLCRNRICVNPDHLEPVTLGENSLRGTGFAAENARKTHCPRGHPYDSANTYINGKGHRLCRTCNRLRARERVRRLAGAVA